jgi:zinc protease
MRTPVEPETRIGELHLTEVDGVPTVWCDVPVPLRAGLVTRMGSADETLPISGISHLLEHLALFGIGRPAEHTQGYVDQTLTHLHTSGEPEEVVTFLRTVTRQMGDPPRDRLEAERGVIEAELAGKEHGVFNRLFAWRYGARTYGLVSQHQYGVSHLGIDALREWSRRFVTRGNTVLWMSGPPPAGLRLDLPDGIFQAAPDPRVTVLPTLPAWFPGVPRAVAMMAIVPTGAAATALGHILSNRLVDVLRTRRAVAYSPTADVSRITGEAARLLAYTDLVADPTVHWRGVDAFVDALHDLGRGPGTPEAVSPEELRSWQVHGRRCLEDPSASMGVLTSAAVDTLHRREVRDLDTHRAHCAAVTCEEIREVAVEAWESLLVCVPSGLAPYHDCPRAPESLLPPLLDADQYRHRNPRVTERLLATADAVAVRTENESYLEQNKQIVVSADSTAVLLRWPDGRRMLIGEDACCIDVEPSMWRDGMTLVKAIDARWPAHIRVEMPERPTDRVPVPPRSWTRWRSLKWIGRQMGQGWLLVFLLVPVSFLVGLPWIAAAEFVFAEIALIFAISRHDDFAPLRRRLRRIRATS